MDCFRKCFLQPKVSDDDGYFEPIDRASERHVATVEDSAMGRRPSRASIDVKDLSDLHGGKNIRWSEMVNSLHDMDFDDLNDARHDEAVYDSVNNLAERESDLFDTMGRLTMGSLFTEDSVSRGLGGFSSEEVDKPDLMDSDKITGILKSPSHTASRQATGEIVKFDGKESFKTTARKVMFITSALKKFAQDSAPSDYAASSTALVPPGPPAITSIAALSGGFFLSASLSKDVITMHKTVGEKVEFVREFKGHQLGITALATIGRKGRFLSAGINNTVDLWDSRFNIEEESDDETGMQHDPITLLATFNGFKHNVHSIGVLDEGSFVRPTDDVDMTMVTAMAKKTALEGATSVQRAAMLREIIECSGLFATSSKNEKKVQIWNMSVAKDDDENAAKISLVRELEQDARIVAMSVTNTRILTGDIMGAVHMWEVEKGKRRSFLNKGGSWTKIHKFTPWKKSAATSPEEKMRQSIRDLCFLNNETFVSGTNNGVIRVWPNIESMKDFEVNKKQASSVKVTSKSVTCIQKLQQIKDPNTGEKCMAFSASFADGRMVSMAMYPQDPSEKGNNELVMFHVFSNSPTGNSKTTAINSIALSEDVSGSNGLSSEPILVAGDGNGNIQTLKPRWNSASSASV